MKTLLITLLTLITLSTSGATLNLNGKKPITIEVKTISNQVQFGNHLAVEVTYDKEVIRKGHKMEVYLVTSISTTNKHLKKVRYIYRVGNRYFLMTSKLGTLGYIED